MVVAMAEPDKARGRRLPAPETDQLVVWLAEDQHALGLSDADYAARLGLSKPHWINIRTRRRRVGRYQVERICRFYPPARAAYSALFLEPHRPGGGP
jgi:hypothetical protein